MSNKVVVPRFNVPSGRSSWTVRVLWAVGGLVVVQMGVFAVVVWKHQGVQAASMAQTAAPAAAVIAAAGPEQVAAPSTAPAAETAAAPVAEAAKPADTAPRVAHKVDNKERSARKSSRSARRGSSRVLAKASPSAKTAALPKPNTGKPDALDELLKRFK